MAVNCVNKSLPEFKKLADESGINDTILASKISIWQDSNGLDKFPSIEDLGVSKSNLVVDKSSDELTSFITTMFSLGVGTADVKQSDVIKLLKKSNIINKKRFNGVFVTPRPLEGNPMAEISLANKKKPAQVKALQDISSINLLVRSLKGINADLILVREFGKVESITVNKDMLTVINDRAKSSILNKLAKETTVKGALDVIMSNKFHEYSRTLAASIHGFLENASDIQIEYISDEEMTKDHYVTKEEMLKRNPNYLGTGFTPGGLFRSKQRKILINTKTFNANTVMHEILHSLSHSALRSESEAAHNFNRLYHEFYLKTRQKWNYGYTNVDEFLVGIFTDRELISDLANMDAIDKGRFSNFLDEVVSALSELLEVLGIKIRSNSALKEVMAAGINLMGDHTSKVAFEKTSSEYYDSLNYDALENEMFSATPREQSNFFNSKTGNINSILTSLAKIKGLSVKYNEQTGASTITTTGNNPANMSKIFNATNVLDNALSFSIKDAQFTFSVENNSTSINTMADKASDGSISVSDALSIASNSNTSNGSSNDTVELIQNLVKSSGIDPKIVFLTDEEMQDMFGDNSSVNNRTENQFSAMNTYVNGMYIESANVIYINRNKATQLTLMHELLHAATAKYLKTSNSAAVAQLRSIYSELSKEARFKGWHELSSFDEFIVGLYTSPELISTLVSSESTGGKTVYERIVDYILQAINSLIGNKNTSKATVNEMMNISNQILSEASKFTNKGSIKLNLNGASDINYNDTYAKTISELTSDGIRVLGIDGINMSPEEKLLALYTVANGERNNESSVKYLSHIISGLPIARRINFNIEDAVLQTLGFTENNLSEKDESIINTAIRIADNKLSSVKSSESKKILNRNITNEVNLMFKAALHNQKNLPALSQDEVSDVAYDIAKMVAIRANAFKKRGHKELATTEKAIHSSILESNEKGEFLQSIMSFLGTTEREAEAMLSEFNRIDSSMRSKDEIAFEKLSEYSMKLTNMENFISSYEPMMDTISSLMADYNDTEIEAGREAEYVHALDYISSIDRNMRRVKTKMYELSVDVVGSALTTYKGKYGESVSGMLDENSDISWIKLWTSSMAESTNDLLALTDYATKHALEEARLESYKMKLEFQRAHKILLDSGISNTEFMYEKDKDGKLTGDLINKRKRRQYSIDRSVYYKSVNGDLSLTGAERDQLKTNWNLDPMNNVDTAPKYSNRAAFEAALDTKEKKAFYDLIMSYKGHIDNLLPSHMRHKYRAPQMNQDTSEFLSKVARGESVGSINDYLSDMFSRKADDLEVNLTNITEDNEYPQKFFFDELKLEGLKPGETSSFVTLDQNQVPIKNMPVHFITPINTNTLSTDLINGLTAYADSAFRYHYLEKVVHVIELEKTILKNHTKIPKRDSLGNKIVSQFKIEEKKYKSDVYEGNESNMYKRLDGYLDMIYYGNFNKAGKDIKIPLINKKVNLSKLGDKFGLYVAVNSLALNIYAGIQNPIVAEANMRIEASGKEYFTHTALSKASGIIALELPKDIAEKLTMTRMQNSKLSLWVDYMNTLQKGPMERSNTNSSTKNPLLRMMKTSNLFIINSVGEYYIQSKMSIALALSTKVLLNGKETNLWNAFEVIDKELTLKDGVTNLDGSKYTKEDVRGFIIKQNSINNSLNGIYNDTDKMLFQRYTVGRLVAMFRKFMVPGINRRYDKKHYSFERGQYQEGYYRSAARFSSLMIKDLAKFKFSIAVHWDKMSNNEKRNVFKALTELIIIASATILIGVFGGKGDDDEDKTWAEYMLMYQLYRFRSEMSFFINPNETIRLMKSPAAAVSQIDNLSNLFMMVFDPDAWTEKIRSGKNKDKSPIGAAVDSAIPMKKTIQGAYFPQDKLKFFILD